MTLVIDVAPEVERKLWVHARRHGVSVEEHARALIERSVASEPLPEEGPFHERATREEWHEAFHELVASLRGLVKAPVIPDEALRRENLYEDRGL